MTTMEKTTVDTALSVLAATAKEAEDVTKLITPRVMAARELGASWEEIGDALGISRQAAWERWGKTR